MNLDYKFIGLEKGLLYEILATTISNDNSDQNVPNTACMGIRLLNNNLISIKPYPTTKTFHNLKKFPIVILNFVDDIQLYAITSLKDSKINYTSDSLPKSHYDYLKLELSSQYQYNLNTFPFINSSWAIIICEVEKETISQKKDKFGTITLSEFLLRPILIKKFRESYKLYNRAENLILESLILITRLKIAIQMKNEDLIGLIEHQIAGNKKIVKKFATNEKISKCLEYMDQFIHKLRN
ncbi:MAG: DUF447 domain-containing protein [Candidatus Hermodarchaeota archaeon]